MPSNQIEVGVHFKVEGAERVERLKQFLGGTAQASKQASADGDKAESTFTRMKNAAKGAADKVKELSNGFKALAKGNSGTSSQVGTGLDRIKSALKGIDYPMKNLFKSLMRIAKLRLLRGIIRSITGAFKEGLSNIYQYSAAMNNMDASHMKGSMDSLASSLLYMKNAVASAVAPLIAQLVPAIATVANWFVTAASAVAQFFAALGGQTTYTRAKKEAVEWGNVAGAAGGAAAAAQEYKNTILGFDEIHALNDVPSGGGGGGGGGGATPDYSNMFEEAEISAKIKNLVQWLKDNWDEIWSIVRHIGEALLAWRIAQGVIDFFEGLGLYGVANGVKKALGITIAIIGIDLAFEGGYSIGYNGFSVMNIIQSALGLGVAAIGGALAFGPAGAIISFGIALVGTIIGFQIGEREKHLDETYRLTDGYIDMLATMNLVNEVLSHNITITSVAKDAINGYTDTLAKIKMAETLIPQIEALSSQIGDSGFKSEKLKFLIEQLNGLGLEGISAHFDEETGKVEMNTDAIYDNMRALRERAKEAALQKVMQTAYEEQARALVDNQLAVDALNHADTELAKAQQALLDYETEYAGTLDYSQDKYDELQQAVWDWQDTQSTAYEAVEKTDKDLKAINKTTVDTERAIDNLTFDIKEAAKQTGLAESEIQKLRDTFIKVGGTDISLWKVQQQFQNTGWSAQDAANKAWDLYKKLQNLNGMSVRFTVAATTVSNGIATTFEKMSELAKKARGYAEGGFIPGFANGGWIPSYATGGINSANLFMAHENAAPELVGRIGNHTAVANTSQMVDAMAQGVYRAMSEVMSTSQGQTEVNVYMDGQRVARAVDNANRVRNRRFNVQA